MHMIVNILPKIRIDKLLNEVFGFLYRLLCFIVKVFIFFSHSVSSLSLKYCSCFFSRKL